ncbi:MAG: UvrD-helicase domain-containing protein, partial [Mailhella sp.]
MIGSDFVERLVIKASAGTGKTHNLTGYYLGSLGCISSRWNKEERDKFPIRGTKPCEPEEIIAVTFTRKAANELKERLRRELLKEGSDMAARVDASLIGTVHSVCLRLLQEYALEAGISPVVEELSDEDGAILFRRAAAPLMENYAYLDELFETFGISTGNFADGRKRSQPMLDFCRSLIGLARINGIEGRLQGESDSQLEKMGRQSFNSVL